MAEEKQDKKVDAHDDPDLRELEELEELERLDQLDQKPKAVSTDPQVKAVVDARQGVTGHGVRYVLTISIGLVIIAFIVAYFVARP